MGVPICRARVDAGIYRSDSESYKKFAEVMTDIGRKLKEAGLTFIYHNHSFEFAKFGGRTGMDILLEETDPQAVDFELDVYWVQAGGADPIEWIRKVEGRMKVVHLKDMAVMPDGEQRFAEIGEGNMNMRGILQACVETGVEWAPVEQDQCYGRDPFESLALSLKNLPEHGLRLVSIPCIANHSSATSASVRFLFPELIRGQLIIFFEYAREMRRVLVTRFSRYILNFFVRLPQQMRGFFHAQPINIIADFLTGFLLIYFADVGGVQINMVGDRLQ